MSFTGFPFHSLLPELQDEVVNRCSALSRALLPFASSFSLNKYSHHRRNTYNLLILAASEGAIDLFQSIKADFDCPPSFFPGLSKQILKAAVRSDQREFIKIFSNESLCQHLLHSRPYHLMRKLLEISSRHSASVEPLLFLFELYRPFSTQIHQFVFEAVALSGKTKLLNALVEALGNQLQPRPQLRPGRPPPRCDWIIPAALAGSSKHCALRISQLSEIPLSEWRGKQLDSFRKGASTPKLIEFFTWAEEVGVHFGESLIRQAILTQMREIALFLLNSSCPIPVDFLCCFKTDSDRPLFEELLQLPRVEAALPTFKIGGKVQGITLAGAQMCYSLKLFDNAPYRLERFSDSDHPDAFSWLRAQGLAVNAPTRIDWTAADPKWSAIVDPETMVSLNPDFNPNLVAASSSPPSTPGPLSLTEVKLLLRKGDFPSLSKALEAGRINSIPTDLIDRRLSSTVKRFCEGFPEPFIASLRWFLFHSFPPSLELIEDLASLRYTYSTLLYNHSIWALILRFSDKLGLNDPNHARMIHVAASTNSSMGPEAQELIKLHYEMITK